MRCLFLLFATSAILALGFSAVVDLNQVGEDKLQLQGDGYIKKVQAEVSGNDDNKDSVEIGDDIFAEDDDDSDDEDGEDVFDPDIEVDGFAFKDLTVEEIYALLEEDDNVLSAELDFEVATKVIAERRAHQLEEGKGRKKRWVPLAIRLFQGGRALFRAARAGRLSRSGSRLTRQYTRNGNYRDAVRDFNRFRPDGRSTFNGRVSGQTGTVGRHRITVRDGSSSGRPTLEIRSPRGNGEYVRKFRYNN